MRKEIINEIYCPECSSNSWEFEGHETDNRFVDGILSCNNGHSWVIRQDVLRFDKQMADEEMAFSEHDLTGYPKDIPENERNEFLNILEKFIIELDLAEKCYLVWGSPILLFRYLARTDKMLIVINEDEGVLRQIQNHAVQKQMFSTTSYIRSSILNIKNNFTKLSFFSNKSLNYGKNKGDFKIKLENIGETKSTILWKGSKLQLITDMGT